MRSIPLTIFTLSLLTLPLAAQKRAAPKQDLDFGGAVAAAQKAFEAQDYGGAVTALQAAIKAVQKLQRVTILAALPKPAGYTVKDEQPEPEGTNPFAAGMAMLGMTVKRTYENSDGNRIECEVMVSSPMVSMLSMMFNNPALITADGGELVEYGQHKAILKKEGDDGRELSILLHNKHLVKVTSQGLSSDALLAVIDQACVDRLEKALGK